MDKYLIILILSALCLLIIYNRYETLKCGRIENFAAATEAEAVQMIKTIHKKPTITVQNLTTNTCNLIPRGTIIMWHGSTTTIPRGWIICDGRNGTPNTLNRYPIGSTSTGTAGALAISASGPTNTTGNHAHGVTGASTTLLTGAGGINKGYIKSASSLSTSGAGNHAHTATINRVTQADPLRTSVIFIMKT